MLVAENLKEGKSRGKDRGLNPTAKTGISAKADSFVDASHLPTFFFPSPTDNLHRHPDKTLRSI